jgi:hypothetical protein
MEKEDQIILGNELLYTLLRTNLAPYLGHVITQDVLNDLTWSIIDSINFFVRKKYDV